jgi:hypothetical protein
MKYRKASVAHAVNSLDATFMAINHDIPITSKFSDCPIPEYNSSDTTRFNNALEAHGSHQNSELFQDAQSCIGADAEHSDSILTLSDVSQLAVPHTAPLANANKAAIESTISPIKRPRRKSVPQVTRSKVLAPLAASPSPHRQILPKTASIPRAVSVPTDLLGSDSGIFEIVKFDSRDQPISCGISKKRGTRKGPLTREARESAQKVRQQKTVCVRCKKDRQPVSVNGCVITFISYLYAV